MSSQTISTKLEQITKRSENNPTMVFTTLAHHMDVDFLGVAFSRLRKKAASGIDKVTWLEYGENLEENLKDLHVRLKEKKYRATPSRRVWIDKDDGKRRGLGIPVIEDKIVQKAVAMLLEAIYEPIFKDFSYGFRRERSATQAVKLLRERCYKLKINWIVDADISGYFDSINHRKLMEILRKRVNDGTILRLIGKWLNAGIEEDGIVTLSTEGTPQGGVISPILSNIYLHYVLDEWFEKEVCCRMKGKCHIIRFADDFVIGFEYRSDAERVFEVLPKRFAKFGLDIHPAKSRLVQFSKPNGKSGKGTGTFDFLGFTFHWARSRQGYWVIKLKTKRKSLNKFMSSLWDWCKFNRHLHIAKQHEKLSSKVRGHYNYFGFRGNYKSMKTICQHANRAWKRWLNDRCHKENMNWEKFNSKILKLFPLPKPKIVHS